MLGLEISDKNKKNVTGGGGQKSAKKVTRIIWMAPKLVIQLMSFYFSVTWNSEKYELIIETSKTLTQTYTKSRRNLVEKVFESHTQNCWNEVSW